MIYDARVGEDLWGGLAGFEPVGSDPVAFRSAEIVDVPRGLEIVDIYAVDTEKLGEGLINWRGNILADHPRLELQPVSDVLLSDDQAGRWQLLVHFRARKRGRHLTGGVRVEYEVDGRTGAEEFVYVIGADSSAG